MRVEMTLTVGSGDKIPINIYVNNTKHNYYGFRARIEKGGIPGWVGVWEDSYISRAEAIGKLLMYLTGQSPKTRRGRW